MNLKKISLLLLLILPILIAIPYYQKEENILSENLNLNNEELIPKSSYSYVEITTQYIDPLSADITKHWSWYANNKGWCSGTGVISNPYVIQDLMIDLDGLSGSCLIINNTNGIYFEVKNCKFQDAQTGDNYACIFVENTNGGIFTNCEISGDSWYGMTLRNSDNNILDDFTVDGFSESAYAGIRLRDDSDNNQIINSYFAHNSYCLRIGFSSDTEGCDNTLVENNEFINGSDLASPAYQTAIYMDGGVGSQNCIIRNNKFSDIGVGGSNYAIKMIANHHNTIITQNTIQNFERDAIELVDSHNIIISGNSITNNGQKGIYADGCDNITIDHNIIEDNAEEGMYLFECDNSRISTNQISRNDAPAFEGGIHIEDTDEIMIVKNIITDNYYDGIFVESPLISGAVHILDNIVKDNGQYGIRVNNPSSLEIINNHLQNNSHIFDYQSMYISSVDFALISNNIIEDTNGLNTDGLYVSSCNFATISGNIIRRIKDEGLYLSSSDYCLVSNNLLEDIGDNAIYNNADYTKISDNIINRIGDTGIYMAFDEFALIDGNIISNCKNYGIDLDWTSNPNTISNNQFISNDLAIWLDNDADYNKIVHNSFIDNNDSILDEGFNNYIMMNYYDNYNGTDANGDGIGDTPMDINGVAGNQDLYPLITPIEEEEEEEEPTPTPTPEDTLEWLWILLIVLGITIPSALGGYALLQRYRSKKGWYSLKRKKEK